MDLVLLKSPCDFSFDMKIDVVFAENTCFYDFEFNYFHRHLLKIKISLLTCN